MASSGYPALGTPSCSIRLLGLQLSPHCRSTSTYPDVPITLSSAHILRTFKLDEIPTYVALSHRWSDQPANVCFELGGLRIYISESLAEGIHQLLRFGMENSAEHNDILWVWVDTICINQNDAYERSNQVRIMRQIYSQAIRTMVWLGPQADPHSKVWTLVDQIYEIVQRTIPQAKSLADIPFRLYSDYAHISLGLPAWDDPLWHQFKELFELSWFSRTWIIQEIVLSRADPILLHGEQKYPWHRLGWAASWLRRNGYMRLPQVPINLQNVDTIANIRRSQSVWNLDALITAVSAKSHATDQRDKIYGLLGLASECSDDDNIAIEALRPTYDGDVAKVYSRVALFLIQRTKSLAILTRTTGLSPDARDSQRRYHMDGLPSWVPDWSDAIVTEREMAKSLAWLDHSSPNDAPKLGFPRQYRASANLPVRLLDSHNPALLRLVGLEVDTVLSAEQCKIDSFSPRHSFLPLLRLWHIALQYQPRNADMIEYLKTWVKVTTAEHHELGGTTADQEVKNGAAYIVKHSGGANYVSQDLMDLANGGMPEAFESLAHNFCFNRKFIITKAGRMGIGPCCTEPGDVVSVLFGGEVPYILRADGTESLSFVGESYIHGLSNGQAIDAWKNGEFREQVFSLQ